MGTLKSWITESEGMLGVNDKEAFKNSANNGITSRDGKRQRCGSNDKMSTKGALFQ